MINPNLKSYYSKVMKQGWGKNSGAREGFKFLMELASFVKNGAILDAGAGHLRLKPFFKDSLYLTQEHESGIQLKGMKNINYDLISPLDQKIPLKDNCLDAVLSNSVLEHLRYPERFLSEAYRVLKPGGRIYISVPFVILEHEVPFDFNRPTRFGLTRWLEDAHFSKINIQPASTCLYSITSYLSVAFVYDLLQTNQNPKTILFNLFHSNKGYIKVIKKIPLFFISGLGYFSLRLLTHFLNLLVNIKPYQKANMPSGWLAVASKPGKYKKSNYLNKEQFLKRNRKT